MPIYAFKKSHVIYSLIKLFFKLIRNIYKIVEFKKKKLLWKGNYWKFTGNCTWHLETTLYSYKC